MIHTLHYSHFSEGIRSISDRALININQKESIVWITLWNS